MYRILIFLAGCTVGYVLGGYADAVTGDGECPIIAGCKKSASETAPDSPQEEA